MRQYVSLALFQWCLFFLPLIGIFVYGHFFT